MNNNQLRGLFSLGKFGIPLSIKSHNICEEGHNDVIASLHCLRMHCISSTRSCWHRINPSLVAHVPQFDGEVAFGSRDYPLKDEYAIVSINLKNLSLHKRIFTNISSHWIHCV